jgi:hypothetical protein
VSHADLSLSPPIAIVRLELTARQLEQIEPLIQEAAAKRQNVLFFALAVPFWQTETRATVWEFQATLIPARIGHKITNLLRTDRQKQRSEKEGR